MINVIQSRLNSAADMGWLSSSKLSSIATSSDTAQSAGLLSSQNASVQDLHAGFGEDTISTPAASMQTLGYGIDAAKKVVPTYEELQQQNRVQLEELRDRQTAAMEARISSRTSETKTNSNSSASATNDANTVNETPQARLFGASSYENVSKATLQTTSPNATSTDAESSQDSMMKLSLNVLA